MKASVCSQVTCYDRREVTTQNRRRRRRASAYYEFTQLLDLDGRTMPDAPDRAALLAYIDLLRSSSR
jgi:hypothetical protein